MNMKNSKQIMRYFKNGKSAEFVNCDAPPLELEKALSVIQEVYDALTGKGLCYIHCFVITDIVMSELRAKLDKIPV